MHRITDEQKQWRIHILRAVMQPLNFRGQVKFGVRPLVGCGAPSVQKNRTI
jgi:hypothetical protein